SAGQRRAGSRPRARTATPRGGSRPRRDPAERGPAPCPSRLPLAETVVSAIQGAAARAVKRSHGGVEGSLHDPPGPDPPPHVLAPLWQRPRRRASPLVGPRGAVRRGLAVPPLP